MYQKIKAKFKANPTIFYACSIVASWAGVGSLMNFRTLAINNGAAAAIIWAVFNSLACIFFGLFAEYIPTVRRIMQSKVMFYFIGFLTVFQTWTQMSGIYEIFGDTPIGTTGGTLIVYGTCLVFLFMLLKEGMIRNVLSDGFSWVVVYGLLAVVVIAALVYTHGAFVNIDPGLTAAGIQTGLYKGFLLLPGPFTYPYYYSLFSYNDKNEDGTQHGNMKKSFVLAGVMFGVYMVLAALLTWVNFSPLLNTLKAILITIIALSSLSTYLYSEYLVFGENIGFLIDVLTVTSWQLVIPLGVMGIWTLMSELRVYIIIFVLLASVVLHLVSDRKEDSAIAKSYVKGTMERWVSQCPHCKGFHELRWEDIRYEYDTIETHGEKTYKVKDVWYLCPECACISDEVTMKRAPAHWQAENPAAYENGIRSFWLNSFVSQWAAWKDTVLKYLNALGDTKKMQVVYNTRLGLLWEDRGDVQDEDTMLGRREEYPAELPDGVLVLTAGVDTQDDRMEYEIVGFGHFGETWGIEKGIISGRPDSDEVWQQLDELVFDRKLKFADGLELPVSIKFVDEGGHFTQEVRQRCHDRIGKKVFCIKGFPGSDRPFTGPPKQVKITVQNRYIGMCWQYQLGVDAGKQIIMDDLKVQEPGPRYCHFPRRDDYGLGYFNGLLSEHLIYKEGHRNPWQWDKISGHERNEPLDCRNYAIAAYKVLPKDLDAIDRALKKLRGKVPEAPAAPVINIQQPVSHPQPSPGRRRENFLDDW